LARTRLHWAIFIPVAIVGASVVILFGLVSFAIHQIYSGFEQTLRGINPANTVPGANFIWALPLIVGLLLLLPLILGTWAAYAKSEVRLTDRRLVWRSGFLSRRLGEVPLENVESTCLSEPLLGRVLDFGNITFTTVGGGSFRLTFVGSPQSFHSILQDAVLKAKNRGRQGVKPPEPPSQLQDDSRYMPKRAVG
jgi:uncharacterized membrane protein YdbT with pleckstrin-like domain